MLAVAKNLRGWRSGSPLKVAMFALGSLAFFFLGL